MSRYFGEVAHIGFIVPDIRAAMAEMAAVGIGPIYLMNQIAVPARYRGNRHDVRLSAAFAYSGSALLEYIEQHDASPSSYREVLARSPAGGMHHIAYFADDFEATIGAATSRGARLEIVQEFFDEATGEPYEIYLESLNVPHAPAIQLMKPGPFGAFYAGMQAGARNWDGSNPIRNALDFIPADIRPEEGVGA